MKQGPMNAPKDSNQWIMKHNGTRVNVPRTHHGVWSNGCNKIWFNELETCPLEWGLWINDEPWTNDYEAWTYGLECTIGLESMD